MTSTTPRTVAKAATVENALPRNSTSLLGVFGPESNMQALIRLSSGRTKRMRIGGRISGNRILAIDKNGLLLENAGKTQRLAIPGG